ncbi:MAG: ATP-binding protein [bacterium]
MQNNKLFIGRKKELAWLAKTYKQAGQTGQLAILYGKRRVGKTELVTHFLKNKPSIYYLASQTTPSQQLESLTQITMKSLGDTHIIGSSFPNWRGYFDYLIAKLKTRKTAKPIILVFDEFPYLIEKDSGISSLFQYGWDMGLKDLRVMIILLGSSMSMMYKHTLDKRAPLYGRRTTQWLLESFTYQESKNFYQKISFKNSFSLYALTGGIPAYLKALDGKLSFEQNIREFILTEGNFLSIEPELLIAEEFDDSGTYLTILKAIGLGRTKFSQILQDSHIPSSSLPIYLNNLISLRLIKKEVPLTEPIVEKSKKGVYSLSDPFLRFYFSFIFPHGSLIKSGAHNTLFKEHSGILTRLLAKSYEDTTLEFIKVAISNNQLPNFEVMGRWWDKNTEIDLVGLDSNTNSILFVETKWSQKPIDVGILLDLKRKSQEVIWGRPDRHEYFGLVSAAGFTPKLKRLAKQENIILIQEDRVVS